jgi:predicted anti-sigma-YlaC factor YlaD
VTCSETASALGAYVLDALDPDERQRFEEHLAHCAVCRDELAEFAPLPAMLDRVRPDDLQPVAVTPSPELYDRVSAAARREQRRPHRTRRSLLVAAALVAVLAVGTGVAVWVTESGGGDTVTASDGPVRATVAARPQNDGSVLDVSVAGLRPGETCRMVAVDDDGGHHPAGEWPVSSAGGGRWRGWADVERTSLREVVLYGDGDRELVRLGF